MGSLIFLLRQRLQNFRSPEIGGGTLLGEPDRVCCKAVFVFLYFMKTLLNKASSMRVKFHKMPIILYKWQFYHIKATAGGGVRRQIRLTKQHFVS